MTFAEAWEQWGKDILLERPGLFPQLERAWFHAGLGNLPRNRWSENVLPPPSDFFGVVILPPEPGFATPVDTPPPAKKKKPKPSPAHLPRGRYFGPPEEWLEIERDYSLHMDPEDYGIPAEDLLWWEMNDPWDPDQDLSPAEVRETKQVAARWSRANREGL